MYCRRCGNKLAESIKYCNRCGAEVLNRNIQNTPTQSIVESINSNEFYYEEPTDEIINIEKNRIALEIVFLTITIAIAIILILSKLTSNII